MHVDGDQAGYQRVQRDEQAGVTQRIVQLLLLLAEQRQQRPVLQNHTYKSTRMNTFAAFAWDNVKTSMQGTGVKYYMRLMYPPS